jgi:hypothetical protein
MTVVSKGLHPHWKSRRKTLLAEKDERRICMPVSGGRKGLYEK